ncbi:MULTISPECIES: carbohydrate ABC transporter permease [unclassified Agreia]|uniref:carbohydrate ABC transporter permease n=1 Tax=unclassified Agreia TaxID=2641148 RepID=UPI0006F5434E|nr:MULTISPECIES: carbohydrate ABC transporter permease [Microbacteriaceae]KQM60968.1 sugar ABC transporter permease [Agreia sp. Leaf210]KQR23892.1 sugar ABC transporter permease [Agreia sp. Leaf335]PPF62175.1 carbohydrate ABC transporter permease [Clavibacter michiganensis]
MKLSLGEKLVTYLVLVIFAAFALVPLLGVVITAVSPSSSTSGFRMPESIELGNFVEAWDRGHFAQYIMSSVIVTITVIVVTTVLSVMAGFAFARLKFFGSNIVFFVLLAGLLLPAEAFIIPLYFNLRSAHVTDSYWALILPQIAQSLAFGIFWMRNQFMSFPGEVIEAARLDGATDLRTLWQIIVPPSIPSIMTMCLLVAMWTWNEFLIPLVMVTQDNLRTAPLGLAFFQGQHATDYSLLAAAGIIIAAPIVVLYFFLQKRFISGMLDGISSR